MFCSSTPPVFQLATCKGLVAGNLQFYDEQGRHMDCNRTKMVSVICRRKRSLVGASKQVKMEVTLGKTTRVAFDFVKYKFYIGLG